MKALHIKYNEDGTFEVESYICRSESMTLETEAPIETPRMRLHSLRAAFGNDNGIRCENFGNGNSRTIACDCAE